MKISIEDKDTREIMDVSLISTEQIFIIPGDEEHPHIYTPVIIDDKVPDRLKEVASTCEGGAGGNTLFTICFNLITNDLELIISSLKAKPVQYELKMKGIAKEYLQDQ